MAAQPSPAPQSAPRLTRVDLGGLAACELDPTHYAVEKLLPRRHVTLLGGHGGSGKSILALALAAHVAVGRTWCGLEVSQGPALYLSLEDPGELVRHRLRRIADAYNLDPAEVAAGVDVLDGSATDSVLASENNEYGARRLLPTAALEELIAAVDGHQLVVIDNASDAFDASENDRRMVRAFVRRLARLAQARDAAVLLLAHIDKSAARFGANNETYSGSTAWHNSVRSRLALTENEPDIQLRQEKLNVAKPAAPMKLTWTDAGVLVPMTENGTEARTRDTADDAAVLDALRAANGAGVNVPTGRIGAATAFSVLKTFAELPAALRGNKERFWHALDRLVRAESVTKEEYRTPSRHLQERLIVRARSTPIPPAIPRALGRAGIAESGEGDSAQLRALRAEPCGKCGGEGCAWCQPKQER